MVKVKVMRAVGERNDAIAREIREELARKGIRAVNLMSSPGSGKTALLEKTFAHFAPSHPAAVIVGDPFTTRDAERLERAGGLAFQLNTEGSCHLTAPLVRAALDGLDLSGVKLLFIENIGNLICPASWDLGESAKAVLLSVAEGADKVEKYRKAFMIAHTVLITKSDLAPSCDFDLDYAREGIAALNPRARILTVSAKTGEGMEEWYGWLREMVL